MSNWLDHTSLLGRALGKVQEGTDVLNLVGGKKWSHLVNEKLPDMVNTGGSHLMRPFEYVDKTINPVRKIPIVDRLGNIVAAKPGDAGALAAGAFFGGEALLGSGGFGGAGGAGAGELGAGAGTGEGLGGLGTASGFGGVGTDAGATGFGAWGGGAGASGADVGGLAAADSAAVDAEGAAPGLTQGYGSASGVNYQQLLGKALNQMGQQKQQQGGGGGSHAVNVQPGNVPWNFMQGGSY